MEDQDQERMFGIPLPEPETDGLDSLECDTAAFYRALKRALERTVPQPPVQQPPVRPAA